MNLKSNIFYLLKIPCSAGRISVTFGKADDDTNVRRAKEAAFDLNKRLPAEVDWFPDADDEKVKEIIGLISAGKPIPQEDLESISKLNAAVYNFGLDEQKDDESLARDILKIDEIFSGLDLGQITGLINRNRQDAEVPPVHEQDVAKEIERAKDDILDAVAAKLRKLSDGSESGCLIKIIKAGQNLKGNGFSKSIADELIIRYNKKYRGDVIKLENNIHEQVKKTLELRDRAGLEAAAGDIAGILEKWAELEMPVSLKALGENVGLSEDYLVIKSMRDLRAYLADEAGMPELAAKLEKDVAEIVSENDAFIQAFRSDGEKLSKIQAESDWYKSFSAGIKELEDTGLRCLWYLAKDDHARLDRIIKAMRETDKMAGNAPDGDIAAYRQEVYLKARAVLFEIYKASIFDMACTLAREIKNEFGDMGELREHIDRDLRTTEMSAASVIKKSRR
jgi:hypothetical protein